VRAEPPHSCARRRARVNCASASRSIVGNRHGHLHGSEDGRQRCAKNVVFVAPSESRDHAPLDGGRVCVHSPTTVVFNTPYFVDKNHDAAGNLIYHARGQPPAVIVAVRPARDRRVASGCHGAPPFQPAQAKPSPATHRRPQPDGRFALNRSCKSARAKSALPSDKFLPGQLRTLRRAHFRSIGWGQCIMENLGFDPHTAELSHDFAWWESSSRGPRHHTEAW